MENATGARPAAWRRGESTGTRRIDLAHIHTAERTGAGRATPGAGGVAIGIQQQSWLGLGVPDHQQGEGGVAPFFCTGCADGQMVEINGWLRNGYVRQHQDERFRANPTAPPRTSCSTPAAQSARFSGMGRKKLRSRMAAEKAAITPIKPTAFPSSLCLCLRSSGCSALLTSTPPVSSRSDLKSALGSPIQMLTRVSRWSSLTNWRMDPPSSRSLTSR